MEMTKVVKPVHWKRMSEYFWQYSVCVPIKVYTCVYTCKYYTCFFFSQTDMFKIVEFVETHEVELVPAIWVENGQCYWPNSLRGMALHLAIKNKTPPNCDWGSWEVRTMFSTGKFDIFMLGFTFSSTLL